MSLRPTPAKLRLLAEVEAGTAFQYGDRETYDSKQYRVTARMAEMQRGGWVVLAEGPDPGVVAASRWYAHKTPWRLTEAGAGVLARARERSERRG